MDTSTITYHNLKDNCQKEQILFTGENLTNHILLENLQNNF